MTKDISKIIETVMRTSFAMGEEQARRLRIAARKEKPAAEAVKRFSMGLAAGYGVGQRSTLMEQIGSSVGGQVTGLNKTRMAEFCQEPDAGQEHTGPRKPQGEIMEESGTLNTEGAAVAYQKQSVGLASDRQWSKEEIAEIERQSASRLSFRKNL